MNLRVFKVIKFIDFKKDVWLIGFYFKMKWIFDNILFK